eukprot:SAG11_NODE_763_length_7292_cov_7.988322_3_plen_893_part_00
MDYFVAFCSSMLLCGAGRPDAQRIVVAALPLVVATPLPYQSQPQRQRRAQTSTCGESGAGYFQGLPGALQGHDIDRPDTSVAVQTVQACEELCTAWGMDCRSFDYSADLRRCYLGNAVEGDDDSALVDAGMSEYGYCYYERDMAHANSALALQFASPTPGLLPGNNLPNIAGGNDYLVGLSADDCAQHCLDYENFLCDSFDYGTQPGSGETRCYLGSCEALAAANCADGTIALDTSYTTYQYYARLSVEAGCTLTFPTAANITRGTCAEDGLLVHAQTCDLACNDGHTPEGEPTVVCHDGTLYQSLSCVPESCTVSAPVNGGWGTCSPSGLLAYGASCSMDCAAGYTLGGSSELVCAQGQILGSQLCLADCDAADIAAMLPLNSNLGLCPSSGMLSHADSCSLGCANGYVADGQQPLCEDGAMSHTVLCQPLSCAAIVTPPHATLQSCAGGATIEGGAVPSGGSCELACEAGWQLSGESTVSCLAGQTTPLPACVPESCAVAAPANGGWGTCSPSGVLPHGASCSMDCAAGYTLSSGGMTCDFAAPEPQRCVVCIDTEPASCYGDAYGETAGYGSSCSAGLEQRCAASCNPRACALVGEAVLRFEFARPIESQPSAQAFGAVVAAKLAAALRVAAGRLIVMSVEGGSTVVTLKLLPAPPAGGGGAEVGASDALQLLDVYISGYGIQTIFDDVCEPSDGSCVVYAIQTAPSDYTARVRTVYVEVPVVEDEGYDHMVWFGPLFGALLLVWLLCFLLMARELLCCRPLRDAVGVRERPWQVALCCGVELAGLACCGLELSLADAWQNDRVKQHWKSAEAPNPAGWVELDPVDIATARAEEAEEERRKAQRQVQQQRHEELRQEQQQWQQQRKAEMQQQSRQEEEQKMAQVLRPID